MSSFDLSAHACVHCQRVGTLYATESGLAVTRYGVTVLEAQCRRCAKVNIVIRA